MLYPLKFKKVFIEKVWGGREFEEKLNMTLPENKKIGESWEISAHPNGMSIVENGFLAGKTLQEVYDKYKEKLVGEKVYNEYGNTFPLLIKYLDVNDRLSIQVHPDDETAMKNHNELGKSESWYIMEASNDATLIMGMKSGITKEEFLKKAENNDFEGIFEEKTVKKGDFIDIIPGTVHASLKGSVLFAEIQENSDVTYRIYDFDRIDSKGVKRELHIQQSAEVIDFNKKVEIVNTDFQKGETRKNLIRKKYYSIDKIKINDEFEDISNESMIIYSILDGTGTVYAKNFSMEVKKGESLLVPPHINVVLKGTLEILRTVIE
ncbi:class I mannose-6-phosphate isomerase [Leptotrichia sp. OH3620_COT-345]|uniref:type I phosphomannose isomerase catalytic subunit n=1 Tax=Leptotrichia sp. OH3620_COT-345 TaxID=2491048 RepID=UPI000F65147A|nr:type I phosphomannose isomerase catalytic subunit [Leptotrichia sp. OH3620_COT-345]RRD38737.1 class I mannose-6-phosphate isomerase [Leptotrichia sp. OH3620_COT-345]